MRMEGKNSYFKRIAQISNFKNIAYSVTKRHQRLLCSYLQCSDFFGRGLECGPGKDVALYIHKAALTCYIFTAKEPLQLASESDLVLNKIKEHFHGAIPSVVYEEYVPRFVCVCADLYN